MAQLTVRKRTVARIPQGMFTFKPGDIVLDTSPFWLPMLASTNVQDVSQLSVIDDFPGTVEAYHDARYPAGLQGGLPANDGDVVAPWMDLGGNNSHLAQGVVASQPTWRNQGMNICPPLADWTLSGAATYDPATQQVSLPQGTTATVWVQLPPWAAGYNTLRFTVDFFCNGQSKYVPFQPKAGCLLSLIGAASSGGATITSNGRAMSSAVGAWSSRTDSAVYTQNGNILSDSRVTWVRLVLGNDATYGSSTTDPILLRLPQLSLAPGSGMLGAATGLYARPDLYCPPSWDAQMVFDQDDFMVGAIYSRPAWTGDSLFVLGGFPSPPPVSLTAIINEASVAPASTSRSTFNTSGNNLTYLAVKGDTGAQRSTVAASLDALSGHILASHVWGYVATPSSFYHHIDGVASAVASPFTDTATQHQTRVSTSAAGKPPFAITAMIRFSDIKSSNDANQIIAALAARAGISANMATIP